MPIIAGDDRTVCTAYFFRGADTAWDSSVVLVELGLDAINIQSRHGRLSYGGDSKASVSKHREHPTAIFTHWVFSEKWPSVWCCPCMRTAGLMLSADV